MVKTIIWNSKANNQFFAIIDYLEKHWSRRIAQNFITETLQTLKILAQFPEMGRVDNPVKKIRVFVITKHNILYYRVDDDKIVLLNFFDTRQHPRKRSDI